MCRIIELLPISNPLRLMTLFVVISALNGCAMKSALNSVNEDYQPFPRQLVENIEGNKFSVAKGDDVVGRLAYISLEKGDTLPDIARHFGLGINDVSAANPGVDMWAPEAGERIMLPLNYILPDAPR